MIHRSIRQLFRGSFRRPLVLSVLLLGFSWHRLCRTLQTEAAVGYVAFKPPGPCAINLYGLPRSFQENVLDALVENVIRPNSKYPCDYYVYFHRLEHEPAGRSGNGGEINVQDIAPLLREQVQLYSPYAQVVIESFTEDDFWQARGAFVNRTRTARNEHGDFLYVPYKDNSFVYPDTTDNIVRMWHGQEGVWELMMQQHASPYYERVAMLRLDVVYLTPLDVWTYQGKIDVQNEYAVIPAFATNPVNDRLIMGPTLAVAWWAAQRFALVEAHVQRMQTLDLGWGMHDERFLKYTILPAIEEEGYHVVQDRDICFLRSRSDGTIWLSDCGRPKWMRGRRNAQKIRAITGKPCQPHRLNVVKDLYVVLC